MGAYRNLPYCVVDSKSFIRYQNMIAAERELEEETLLDLLNEVEEEVYEEKITEFTSVFNANKILEDET